MGHRIDSRHFGVAGNDAVASVGPLDFPRLRLPGDWIPNRHRRPVQQMESAGGRLIGIGVRDNGVMIENAGPRIASLIVAPGDRTIARPIHGHALAHFTP